jgi:hypothetical protein
MAQDNEDLQNVSPLVERTAERNSYLTAPSISGRQK